MSALGLSKRVILRAGLILFLYPTLGFADMFCYLVMPSVSKNSSQSSRQFEPIVVPSNFNPVIERMRGKTQVPIVLPDKFDAGLYPFILTLTSSEYEISLDATSDCQGAGACNKGHITGRKVKSTIPVGTRNFPFRLYRKKARSVTLANGIRGHYIESFCGANCDDAKVFWIQNGYQFMVGLKGGKLEDVVKMANSAIANQQFAQVKR